jgi:ribosomal protein L7/L12
VSTDPDVFNRIAALERKVSFLLQHLGIDADEAPAVTTDDEVMRLVRLGKTIDAIKLYRERTGVGLAEAKTAIDQLRSQLGH